MSISISISISTFLLGIAFSRSPSPPFSQKRQLILNEYLCSISILDFLCSFPEVVVCVCVFFLSFFLLSVLVCVSR